MSALPAPVDQRLELRLLEERCRLRLYMGWACDATPGAGDAENHRQVADASRET